MESGGPTRSNFITDDVSYHMIGVTFPGTTNTTAILWFCMGSDDIYVS